jgi:hypothetical protein
MRHDLVYIEKAKKGSNCSAHVPLVGIGAARLGRRDACDLECELPRGRDWRPRADGTRAGAGSGTHASKLGSGFRAVWRAPLQPPLIREVGLAKTSL